MKPLFAGLLFLVLFMGFASAENISVSLDPQSQVILLNETAMFQLTVSHDGTERQSFEVFSSDVLWDVRLNEAPIVGQKEQKTVSLYLKPLYVSPGVYGVPIFARIPRKSEDVKTIAFVDVRSTGAGLGEYLPAIRGKASMQKTVDPRETAKLTIALETENKWKGNVTIKIRGKLFNKDLVVWLGALENKTTIVDIPFDPKTPPQQDSLTITVIAKSSDGKAYPVQLAPVDYSIMGFSDITKSVSTEESFLKTVETITLENKGNTVGTATYAEDSSMHSALFVSYNQESFDAESEQGYAWTTKLLPGNAFVLMKTTSYRWIAVLMFLVVVGIVSYYVFRSPIAVRKVARVLATREGGITELKVLVFVINRSKSMMNHVKVRDLIPRLALLEKETEIGSAAPEKVLRNEEHGTLLKWEFNCLEPGEERIIRYRIRSKLSIIDGLTLPPASVSFETNTGRERKTSSSSAEISLSSK